MVETSYAAYLYGGIFGDQINAEETDRAAFLRECLEYAERLMPRLAFTDKVTMYVTESETAERGWARSRTRTIGVWHLVKGADAPRLELVEEPWY